jgi:metal-dependent amidase/aminoacylase/carboxypeptidase family protein
MTVIAKIENACDELARWRHDIHAHPELGFAEERTAALVAEQLARFGCEVHRRVGRTGVVSMASEDLAYTLDQRPGAYLQIGNGDGKGGREVHNPGYDFNDRALTLGASLFARIVERKLTA